MARYVTWLYLLSLLAAIVCGATGCIANQEPVPSRSVQSQPAADPFDFEPYLRAFRLGHWVYERHELRGSHALPAFQKYVRFSSLNRTIEGNLIGRSFLPLVDYLHTGLRGKALPAEQRKTMPPLKGGTAFLFELAEPLEPMPAELTPETPIVSTTPLMYYDYDGKPLSSGILTRTVELEGFEDIVCPAGSFARCARVRIQLEVRVSWVLYMSMTNYLWISPEVGEVRRQQHMSGRFVIFLFSSAYQLDLVSGRAMLNTTRTVGLAPKWKYGAVLLDRVVPRPRLAGMVIDYAEHVTRIPTSIPANARPGMTAGSVSGGLPTSQPDKVGGVGIKRK